MLNRRQIAILAIGGSITFSIGAFYVIKDKTNYWSAKPLTCQTFPTEDPRFDKKVEVCINGVSYPYAYMNGDVELDMTFKRGKHEVVQADVVFWVADQIAGKRVDYTGEMNFTRVRLYEDGILAVDIKQKFSTWVNPVVPEDVRLPLWKWVNSQAEQFDRTRLPLDEKFHALLGSLINMMSVATSAGLTVWRMIKAQG